MADNLRVNYDTVAGQYDRRTQGGYLSGVNQALRDLSERACARRVLDLGCGTGRSLVGPAGLVPNPVCIGLDFSAGMLAKATAFNPAYRLVRASAPQPPFAPESFDMVYCVHAFHHFPDKERVVTSAYGLLRPGGAFAIVNFDPREGRDDWYVYRYFDGVYERDLQRFPALADKEAMLRAAGFVDVRSPVVETIEDDLTGAAVFDSYFLQKDSCSQLILLSDADYQAGLRRIRIALAEAESRSETLTFPSRILNRMCHGIKPNA